jgi:predicted RND superfamily exporter protein
MRDLFEGYTHNQKGDIAVVVCMLEPETEFTPPRRAIIDAIRAGIQSLPDDLEPGMITGEPVMLVDGFRYVEQDGHRLSIWSSILLGLTILVFFRSIRWMLICVAVVQLALLLTRVSMSLLDLRLSMVSSMLTAVVTVVGVATVVHIIVRFREARQLNKSPLRALTQSTAILLVPVFWACITDAVGFAALKSASVAPVGDFGVMMAISCLAVLASVWLIVPGLATLGPTKTAAVSSGVMDRQLRSKLHALAGSIEKRTGLLSVGALIVVGSSLVGLRFLEVETDFTRNFRRGSQIVRAYQFVETHLGGAGVGDILIPAPKRLTWKYLRRVRAFEERVEAESRQGGPLSGLTKVLSLADAVVAGAPQLNVQSKSTITSELVTRSGLALMRARIPAFYDALYAEDPEQPGTHYLRIMFRAREQQEAVEKRALIARLEELGREYFPDESHPVAVTGFFVLLTHLIDNIVKDQWTTFGIAVAGIGLTMLLAFRNVPISLIALLPNALPVLIVSGLMGWMKWLGWFDFRINMGSAMIAAVSLGLSIDSSIHYIFAYRRAKSLGNSTGEAIAAAHGTVGLSMIFATLALIVGFSVLATSKFTPTVYFGSLVSLAMLGGLLGNLVVLPVMLRVIDGDHLLKSVRQRAQSKASLKQPTES